jgi:hypothetical protein
MEHFYNDHHIHVSVCGAFPARRLTRLSPTGIALADYHESKPKRSLGQSKWAQRNRLLLSYFISIALSV